MKFQVTIPTLSPPARRRRDRRVINGRGGRLIRFRALILVAVICLFQVHCLLADAGEDKIENVLITPFIGDYLWLAEAYLISEGPFGSYLGAVTDSDVFGGFADADGDGLEDLLIVVDHDITCERTLCDFLVFAPVVEDRQLNAACDWRLVDDRRRNIVRGLYERFAIVGDIAVPLTRLPSEMQCTLNGRDWQGYLHSIYDSAHYIKSEKLHRAALSDLRLGAYDLNGDGQDEVFIYIPSNNCPCGWESGHVIEIEKGADGSSPTWKRIGRLEYFDPVLTSIDSEPTFLAPSATLHVTDEVIDGYRSLCSSRMILRWDGEAYVLSVYINSDTLLQEVRALGCPTIAPTQAADAPIAVEPDE